MEIILTSEDSSTPDPAQLCEGVDHPSGPRTARAPPTSSYPWVWSPWAADWLCGPSKMRPHNKSAAWVIFEFWPNEGVLVYFFFADNEVIIVLIQYDINYKREDPHAKMVLNLTDLQ